MICDLQPRQCAIYTRKSNVIGLDKDYSSLESQRDICAAFITSQRHKGWVELPQRYDDAAQSGGNLDRPALQQLIRDIEVGRVDVVIIYKMDRLTRSLADFVRLLELFERFHVSIVSVTQAFDTADTMGRLVMNILLTFAQFEREMMIDRIRDKVAMMRKRGKRTGGPPPFGYDAVKTRLRINQKEAEIVRWMFQRYLELGCYRALCEDVAARGLRTKAFTTKMGKPMGGRPMTRGFVYYLLSNPLYIGKVRFQGELYEGEHSAIVSKDLWDAACALREKRALKRPSGPSPHILLGLLYDAHGRKIVMKIQVQGGRKFRYYTSESSPSSELSGLKRYRARAEQLEDLVGAAIKQTLCSSERLRSALLALGRHGPELETHPRRGSELCRIFDEGGLERKRELLVALIARGEISRDRLKLLLRCSELERLLWWDGQGLFRGNRASWTQRDTTLLIDIPVQGVLSHQGSIVLPLEPQNPWASVNVNPRLVATIREARKAQAALDERRTLPLAQVAKQFNREPGAFARLVRLNYLAPDIVAAIFDGTQPAGLTNTKLRRAHLPMDWALQRLLFGFPARPDHQLTAIQQRHVRAGQEIVLMGTSEPIPLAAETGRSSASK